MLLDMQGSKYTLYDPEIATTDLCDADGEVHFCSKNLSEDTIKQFFEGYTCNKFCKIPRLVVVMSTDI